MIGGAFGCTGRRHSEKFDFAVQHEYNYAFRTAHGKEGNDGCRGSRSETMSLSRML
jgi:hypothetical protein